MSEDMPLVELTKKESSEYGTGGYYRLKFNTFLAYRYEADPGARDVMANFESHIEMELERALKEFTDEHK